MLINLLVWDIKPGGIIICLLGSTSNNCNKRFATEDDIRRNMSCELKMLQFHSIIRMCWYSVFLITALGRRVVFNIIIITQSTLESSQESVAFIT